MCQRAVCRSCRKLTHEGCGKHVDQVLMGVPTAQRCTCEPAERKRERTVEAATRSESVPARQSGASRRTPAPGSLPGRSRGGCWARLIDWVKRPA
ncbi:hypothetical protein B1H19_19480 [Streptomyces gilvosporeus]|uniref:Uncharacterized protein n=1 Tax=Streptomyces gilvosporeus TaxID=553510 RepID=A0A1V0TTA7_9ACTN|nr:hypothetical protein B1H19_19480 [Streptomyces gilvosporeus]